MTEITLFRINFLQRRRYNIARLKTHWSLVQVQSTSW